MRRHEVALALCLAYDATFAHELSLSERTSSINHGAPLRILPLGASITLGLDSTGLNGYREPLRQLLENNGNNVTYVGTRHIGTMDNNAVQATSGQTIQQIDMTALETNVYRFAPNVILLNAGTNNCDHKDVDPSQAPAAYAQLLKNIRLHLPETLTVVSSLIPNLRPKVNACIESLNPKIKQVVMQASAEGQKIAFVDMFNAIPMGDINTRDSTHPTDAGYEIMAHVWFNGLVHSSANISSPPPTQDSPSPSASSTARPTPHSFAVPTVERSWSLSIISSFGILYNFVI